MYAGVISAELDAQPHKAAPNTTIPILRMRGPRLYVTKHPSATCTNPPDRNQGAKHPAGGPRDALATKELSKRRKARVGRPPEKNEAADQDRSELSDGTKLENALLVRRGEAVGLVHPTQPVL
jgi:hypothetical protein